eukprot:5454788-Prymnesium_polylepis.1
MLSRARRSGVPFPGFNRTAIARPRIGHVLENSQNVKNDRAIQLMNGECLANPHAMRQGEEPSRFCVLCAVCHMCRT